MTAAIFIAKDVKVYLFSKVVPTPFVPYGILKYKCAAGIMVTASHNPKNDNGYKVYWENGAQIISPHDKKIQKYILENLEPIESSWDAMKVYDSSLYKDRSLLLFKCKNSVLFIFTPNIIIRRKSYFLIFCF